MIIIMIHKDNHIYRIPDIRLNAILNDVCVYNSSNWIWTSYSINLTLMKLKINK